MGDGDIGVIEVVDLEKVHYSPISCRGRNKKDAILVEEYSDSMASLLQTKSFIDLTQVIYVDDDDEEVQEINPTTSAFRKKPFRYPSVSETGQSSSFHDSKFICEICFEPKSSFDSFKIKGCKHFYCSECMAKYVASKLQENVTSIRCPVPDCLGVLEPEFSRTILPQEVFDRWGDALCESLILGAQKFYCPFKDCSALLIDDGGVAVKDSECPHCRRMFCAQCKVPWHTGINCKDFQKLGKGEREKEDILLMNLAKDKKWQRCPKCKFYVERSDGCLFMKCRCGFAFCYNCAAPMQGNNHNCTKCKR
ncbi:hypothetical protein AQUCO_02000574v1 [Aquilegia coerulea]|uniref:RBR-type E3 ubiquitin transferase n=1 Tax=Aquilegia coerulea TaxID=218851 RepID=A0A2G5DIB2_AQUCA|nr:hypothetical protein AQUCO_02000574v1 [Aquilegia coerulea]